MRCWQVTVLVQVISDTLPRPIVSVIACEGEAISLTSLGIASSLALLAMTSPSPEIASVALSDLTMTSERASCNEGRVSPIYLNEISHPLIRQRQFDYKWRLAG